MGREEGSRDQDIDRQARAARHEGGDQDGDEPAAAAFDRTAGHDGGHVAAEPHNHRNERLAVQADAVHHAVHDEGRAGQIARVLQKRDEQVEDHDLGQEDDHRAHAADHAVREHVAQRSFGQQGVHSVADPSHQRVEPVLRIGSETERAPEHEPHEREEDRKSPELVRHEGVDERRGLRLLALPGYVGLAQRTLDEAVFLVGERRFDVLAQRLGDAARLAVADFDPFAVAGAAVQHFLRLPVALEQFHGVVAGREGFGQLLAVVAHVAVESPQPFLDHRAHVDVDVAHAVVAVLENVDHRVQQSLYAAVVARLYGNHRHAQHAAQAVVIEFRTAVLQLVEHVECHDYARVYIDQFSS